MSDAERLAQHFHEAYERLAPDFAYQTRKDSAKPWAQVPEDNRLLMIAVAADVLVWLKQPALPSLLGEPK